MPLTPKGNKIMGNMKKQYGAKKAKNVFYASRNAGTISGVDPESGGSETKRTRSDKSGRSLIDIEFHNRKPETTKLCPIFTHPIHKGYDDITCGKLDPPSVDGFQFTPGSQSCNRDAGQGLHYGAPVDFYGPDTEFRTEEINPHHYGRDYNSYPLRDYFKAQKSDDRQNLRLVDEYEYESVKQPGAVGDKGMESSMAYGSISYEKIPSEMDDNRSFDSQMKYRRSQGEMEEDAVVVKDLNKY